MVHCVECECITSVVFECHILSTEATTSLAHRRSLGVQWVYLHPQGG